MSPPTHLGLQVATLFKNQGLTRAGEGEMEVGSIYIQGEGIDWMLPLPT